MLPYLTSWAGDACYFTSASDGYSMFALIPCSGYYSGASLEVRFVALLHTFFTLLSSASFMYNRQNELYIFLKRKVHFFSRFFA